MNPRRIEYVATCCRSTGSTKKAKMEPFELNDSEYFPNKKKLDS